MLARQTCRGKPSAQHHSNIPYKATVQPVHLQISWLTRYARQLATNGVGRGPAVDMRTFRDHILFLYEFALAMAPLATWLMSARQQPRVMRKYRHLTLANNRKHTPCINDFVLVCETTHCVADITLTTIETNENTPCTTRHRLKSK